jgi:hypothetical protein
LIVPGHQITHGAQLQIVKRVILNVRVNLLHFGSTSWASKVSLWVHYLLDTTDWPMFPSQVRLVMPGCATATVVRNLPNSVLDLMDTLVVTPWSVKFQEFPFV